MEEQTNNHTNQVPPDTYREPVDPAEVSPKQEIRFADLPPIPNTKAPVKNLRTFESDVAEQVEHGTTLSRMVLAEAEKRADAEPLSHQQMDPARKKMLRLIAVIAGVGVISLTTIVVIRHFAPGAAAVPNPAANSFLSSTQPLIFLNEVKEVPIKPADRNTLISALLAEKTNYSGTLGAIRGLYPTISSTSSKEVIPAFDLVQLLSPSAPQSLLRSLDQNYVLGIHAFDGNQFFLILKDNFYENAYAGMLAWENSLLSDFDPIFHRRKIIPATVPDATTKTISTSSDTTTGGASITPLEQSATSSTGTNAPEQSDRPVFSSQNKFTDMVIKNRDVRAVLDERGQIIFLYSFADKNTIIITNSENTLKEVLDRLENAGIAR